MADRALIFVDGNNWYHALKQAGVDDLGRLNYALISKKLIGPRDWTATRYYIGQVRQQGPYATICRPTALLGRTHGN